MTQRKRNETSELRLMVNGEWVEEYRLSKRQRTQLLFELQNGQCWYCGQLLVDGWHHDHIVPRTEGGHSSLDNVRLTCPSCNQRKYTNREALFRFQLAGNSYF